MQFGIDEYFDDRLSSYATSNIDDGSAEADVEIPNKLEFLSLPPELRRNIYRQIVKKGSDSGGIIVPVIDMVPTQDSMAIARTCQDVHDEVTDMLYGTNLFVFTYQENRYYEDMDWEPGYEKSSMYNWLKEIGRRNRFKLRKLKVQIHMIDTDGFDMDFPYSDDDLPFHFSWTRVIGAHLAQSFNLLSTGHNLTSLALSLFDDDNIEDLFRGGFKCGLMKELMKLKGLQTFTLLPVPHYERHQWLLEKLTSVLTTDDRPAAKKSILPLMRERRFVNAELARLESRKQQLDSQITKTRADASDAVKLAKTTAKKDKALTKETKKVIRKIEKAAKHEWDEEDL